MVGRDLRHESLLKAIMESDGRRHIGRGRLRTECTTRIVKDEENYKEPKELRYDMGKRGMLP